MPFPCPYWPASTPPGAKTLNIGLYADDGSATGTPGVPTGIFFHANARPVLLECIQSFVGSVPGNGETGLNLAAHPGSVYWNLLDVSGATAAGADIAGERATYQFTAVQPGSAGDGTATPGGWHLVSHVIPMGTSATQQMVGANLMNNGTSLNSGSRQAPNNNRDNAPFYLDLQLATSADNLQPSVVNWDHTNDTPNVPGSGTGVDAFSGETPRFLTVWAGPVNGSWMAPDNTPALPTPFTNWTAATTIGTTSAATVNVNGSHGLADVVNFLSSPPLFRNHNSSGQNIPSTSNTKVTLASSGLDTYGGYTPSSSTYTVQRDGIYLAHGVTAWDSLTSDTAQRVTGIAVNGTIYWGPGYMNAPLTEISSSLPLANILSTKTQIFSLRAGDTVQLWCRQNSGSDVNTSTGDQCRLILMWLGAPGVPSTLWQPPDTTFRWSAGTPGADLPTLMQAHFANDLGFLVNRPFLLSWQDSGATESGLSQNDWHRVNMNNTTGIVHGDAGDNYGGFSGLQYTSQRAGWYLAVAEYFATFPTSPPASLVAGFSVPTSGGFSPVRTPDWYQHILMPPANFTPGATAVGLYYLLEGETIQPQAMAQDTGGTWGTAAGTVNGGAVNSHFELAWICE